MSNFFQLGPVSQFLPLLKIVLLFENQHLSYRSIHIQTYFCYYVFIGTSEDNIFLIYAFLRNFGKFVPASYYSVED